MHDDVAPLIATAMCLCTLLLGLKSINDAMLHAKKLEIQQAAIAAAAWDKLSVKAILKRADPDLRTYFLKEKEYFQAVDDFREQAKRLASGCKYKEVMSLLIRIRASPFFEAKESVELEDLIFQLHWDKPDSAAVKDAIKAIEAFERKL